MHVTDNSKLFKKILLHPGEFIIPRRIYRDCKGLDAEKMMIRLNELVEEGLGCLVERTQQQTIFYKEIPNPDIEDSLKNHGVELEDYRSKFFEVDYKCSERQRHLIKMANPERRLIDRLFLGLLEADGENERFSEDPENEDERDYIEPENEDERESELENEDERDCIEPENELDERESEQENEDERDCSEPENEDEKESEPENEDERDCSEPENEDERERQSDNEDERDCSEQENEDEGESELENEDERQSEGENEDN